MTILRNFRDITTAHWQRVGGGARTRRSSSSVFDSLQRLHHSDTIPITPTAKFCYRLVHEKVSLNRFFLFVFFYFFFFCFFFAFTFLLFPCR